MGFGTENNFQDDGGDAVGGILADRDTQGSGGFLQRLRLYDGFAVDLVGQPEHLPEGGLGTTVEFAEPTVSGGLGFGEHLQAFHDVFSSVVHGLGPFWAGPGTAGGGSSSLGLKLSLAASGTFSLLLDGPSTIMHPWLKDISLPPSVPP
ncbi:MAG: hypothetical protein VR70_05275 [Rhodospirillaceae bacterium BRH_c57]|nr:MAG: hypothetical protein VR70_05275 [Rhodospirillaceae bacterium BRH_c57]